MKTMHTAVVGLAVALAAAGCSLLLESDGDDPRSLLDRNREQWREHAIDDYRYTFERSCFCGGSLIQPVRITVEDGEIVGIVYEESGESVPEDQWQHYETIEGLFDVIDDAIDRDAHRLEVRYDATYGYPESIDIDYEANVADEEQSYSASDLEEI